MKNKINYKGLKLLSALNTDVNEAIMLGGQIFNPTVTTDNESEDVVDFDLLNACLEELDDIVERTTIIKGIINEYKGK